MRATYPVLRNEQDGLRPSGSVRSLVNATGRHPVPIHSPHRRTPGLAPPRRAQREPRAPAAAARREAGAGPGLPGGLGASPSRLTLFSSSAGNLLWNWHRVPPL